MQQVPASGIQEYGLLWFHGNSIVAQMVWPLQAGARSFRVEDILLLTRFHTGFFALLPSFGGVGGGPFSPPLEGSGEALSPSLEGVGGGRFSPPLEGLGEALLLWRGRGEALNCRNLNNSQCIKGPVFQRVHGAVHLLEKFDSQ
jgi:hypothetical protein